VLGPSSLASDFPFFFSLRGQGDIETPPFRFFGFSLEGGGGDGELQLEDWAWETSLWATGTVCDVVFLGPLRLLLAREDA
jgi:hypothetical protein